MTVTLLLGLIASILESLIFFFIGRLLMNSRSFIEYLGLRSGSGKEAEAAQSSSGLIERILARIGILMQFVALLWILLQILITFDIV